MSPTENEIHLVLVTSYNMLNGTENLSSYLLIFFFS